MNREFILYSVPVRYRLFAPADFAALYAIEEACFAPPLRFSRSYMRLVVRDPETATWIAEEDGEMAGFAIVEWGAGKDGPIAYIQTLEVLPAYRRRGVGAELLGRMVSSACSAGAQAIWLHVDEENVSAIRLYTSHGFRIEGREENYYPGGRAALVYGKALQEQVGDSGGIDR